jgi:hypothetical protein
MFMHNRRLLLCFTILILNLGFIPVSNSSGNLQLGARTFPVSEKRPIGRPFGASLHFPGELENDSTPTSTAFAAANFGWTRTCNFLWCFMEPQKDNFAPITDKNAYNNLFLANMKKIGTKVLPLIEGPPGWLNESTNWYISLKNRPLFYRYVNATVSNYQNEMQIWELFNEPNNIWGKGLGTWEEFFELLIGTAETIKKVNSSLEILVGGLGGTQELEYLDRLLANLTNTPSTVPGFSTAKDLFMGIAFHPYSNPAENLMVKLTEYDEVLERYNWTNQMGARHWITEIGGETESAKEGLGGFLDNSQRDFAALLIKQMAIATSWKVDGFNIWTYRDFEAPGSYTNEYAHCGVVFANGSWKPATYACNWSNQFLGNGHTELIPTNIPSPITGIVALDTILTNGREQWTLVLWNPQHEGLINLEIELKTPIVHEWQYDYGSNLRNDIIGEDISTTETNFRVSVGYEPVLLVIECESGANCSITLLNDSFGTFLSICLTFSIGLASMIFIDTIQVNRKGRNKGIGSNH